jgi:opacity protein-like surface antigen
MKKSASLLASGITSVALGLAATPALSQETPTNPFIDYFGAGLVIADVDGFDGGLALVLNAGKEFRGMPGFAVEGEVTTTIDNPDAELGGASGDVSYWTLGGYGAYTIPLGQQFGVRGRLGAVFEDVDVDSNVGGGGSDQEFNLSVGVGANFDVSKQLAVTADYTRIEEDINHYGIGVKFNF